MPTGYTAAVVDGECTSFREFAMTCARAFGALITMRDDSLSTPIPDSIEPDDYHEKAVLKAIDELRNLESLTPEERIAYGKKRLGDALVSISASRSRTERENERIDKMLEEVEAWEPPSPDHEGMKKFMREQLEISRSSTDWYASQIKALIEKTPEVEFAEALDSAKRNIEYHRKNHAEEVERCKSRTQWVRQLRASLSKS
jgi:hypothetical protein